MSAFDDTMDVNEEEVDMEVMDEDEDDSNEPHVIPNFQQISALNAAVRILFPKYCTCLH